MRTIFLNRGLSILIILAVVLTPYAAMTKNLPESLQDKIVKAYPPGTMVIAKKAISGRISAGDVFYIKKIKKQKIILEGLTGKRKIFIRRNAIKTFEDFEKMFLMYFKVK